MVESSYRLISMFFFSLLQDTYIAMEHSPEGWLGRKIQHSSSTRLCPVVCAQCKVPMKCARHWPLRLQWPWRWTQHDGIATKASVRARRGHHIAVGQAPSLPTPLLRMFASFPGPLPGDGSGTFGRAFRGSYFNCPGLYTSQLAFWPCLTQCAARRSQAKASSSEWRGRRVGEQFGTKPSASIGMIAPGTTCVEMPPRDRCARMAPVFFTSYLTTGIQ